MNHTHIRVNFDTGVIIVVQSEHDTVDWDNFSIEDVLSVRVIISRKDGRDNNQPINER